MAISLLVLIALLAEGSPASETCFHDAIAAGRRANVTFAGESMPLRMFRFTWATAVVASEIYKILAEEKLGLNVEFRGSSGTTVDGMYTLAGCTSYKARGLSNKGCGTLRSDIHMAVGPWQGCNLE